MNINEEKSLDEMVVGLSKKSSLDDIKPKPNLEERIRLQDEFQSSSRHRNTDSNSFEYLMNTADRLKASDKLKERMVKPEDNPDTPFFDTIFDILPFIVLGIFLYGIYSLITSTT